MADATPQSFLELPAIRVDQPLGPFYMTRMKARDLLAVTHVTTLQISAKTGDTYDLAGGQREAQPLRRKEVASFIRTTEAAFPNSIILGANFDSEMQFVEDEALRWSIDSTASPCLKLVIPTNRQMAAVIDGQHRRMGFEGVSDEYLDFELPCSVYFDLPAPYQAYVFAVINFNQKKVDKSLAYEMFAFDATSRAPETWAPETLAVHLSRRLNLDGASPFHQHIRVAPQNDDLLFSGVTTKPGWLVSTATVVEGILSLIASNPKRDKSAMHQVPLESGRTRSALLEFKDGAPLRSLFVSSNDKAIYTAVVNFFDEAKEKLWKNTQNGSYIQKTVGIQGLFEVMKKLLANFDRDHDISRKYFGSFLQKSKHIDFSDNFFQASGTGRTRIRNCLLFAGGLIQEEDLGENREDYLKVCHS